MYEVTAKLYDSYFTSNIDSRIDLYILVLANYSDWGISIPAAERGVTTLKEFFKSNDLLPTLQDRQPSTYQLLKADKADAWQRFPMAGLQKVTLEGTKLAQSSKADPYSLPNNINMLRALAKIEIIDKINVPDGDVWNETEDNTGAMGALRIHKAELLGVVDRGSLLPGYDQWVNINGEETQQVSQPSVPKSAKYIKPLLFDKENTSGVIPLGRNIEFEEDNAARQAREDKCPVFSAYVFEYSKLLEEDPGYQPYVRLTTRGGKSEDADGKTESYESTIFPMRLAEYTDGDESRKKYRRVAPQPYLPLRDRRHSAGHRGEMDRVRHECRKLEHHFQMRLIPYRDIEHRDQNENIKRYHIQNNVGSQPDAAACSRRMRRRHLRRSPRLHACRGAC